MFVAAKAFPYGNKRYRLGTEVKREDFPNQEAFDHFIGLGLIKDLAPPAPVAEAEAPAAPAA